MARKPGEPWSHKTKGKSSPIHKPMFYRIGAPSSKHYRKGHVEYCGEVAAFAQIKRARRNRWTAKGRRPVLHATPGVLGQVRS